MGSGFYGERFGHKVDSDKAREKAQNSPSQRKSIDSGSYEGRDYGNHGDFDIYSVEDTEGRDVTEEVVGAVNHFFGSEE